MNIADRILRYNRQLKQLSNSVKSMSQRDKINLTVSFVRGAATVYFEQLHQSTEEGDLHGAVDEMALQLNELLDSLVVEEPIEHHHHHHHSSVIDKTEEENAKDDLSVALNDPDWPSSISDSVEGKHEEDCDCIHCSKQ